MPDDCTSGFFAAYDASTAFADFSAVPSSFVVSRITVLTMSCVSSIKLLDMCVSFNCVVL